MHVAYPQVYQEILDESAQLIQGRVKLFISVISED